MLYDDNFHPPTSAPALRAQEKLCAMGFSNASDRVMLASLYHGPRETQQPREATTSKGQCDRSGRSPRVFSASPSRWRCPRCYYCPCRALHQYPWIWSVLSRSIDPFALLHLWLLNSNAALEIQALSLPENLDRR
ncbi:hypothetical protein PIB30_077681 [Stylosanthes scabra]|uniref:Uncharacterized protein n=1 Tax=Stylosanthes scabra TaxID=79078 RepID=A0ABU6QR79_9FABA|nr:hypothetical protein [Stylosanthes scabra]